MSEVEFATSFHRQPVLQFEENINKSLGGVDHEYVSKEIIDPINWHIGQFPVNSNSVNVGTIHDERKNRVVIRDSLTKMEPKAGASPGDIWSDMMEDVNNTLMSVHVPTGGGGPWSVTLNGTCYCSIRNDRSFTGSTMCRCWVTTAWSQVYLNHDIAPQTTTFNSYFALFAVQTGYGTAVMFWNAAKTKRSAILWPQTIGTNFTVTYYNGTTLTNGPTLSINNWYEWKIEQNPVAKTWSLWYRGSPWTTWIPVVIGANFYDFATWGTDAITNIDFRVYSSSGSNRVNIDDVRIGEPSPAGTIFGRLTTVDIVQTIPNYYPYSTFPDWSDNFDDPLEQPAPQTPLNWTKYPLAYPYLQTYTPSAITSPNTLWFRFSYMGAGQFWARMKSNVQPYFEVVEFDFMCSQLDRLLKKGIVGFMSNGTYGGFPSDAIIACWGQSSGSVTLFMTVGGTNVTPFALNTWYHFKIYYYPSELKYDIYRDSILIGSYRKNRPTGDGWTSAGLNTMYSTIYDNVSDSTPTATFQFDKVEFYNRNSVDVVLYHNIDDTMPITITGTYAGVPNSTFVQGVDFEIVSAANGTLRFIGLCPDPNTPLTVNYRSTNFWWWQLDYYIALGGLDSSYTLPTGTYDYHYPVREKFKSAKEDFATNGGIL